MILYERLKRVVRGDYNSIRHRYWRLPREWLSYLVGYRLAGRSWIDYYARRLDAAAAATETFNAEYLARGAEHLAYLRRHGLQPHHRVLDYGCGAMRSGVEFASYLERGKYVGVDISGDRLARGVRLLADRGIDRDAFEAILVRDCRLEALAGRAFDFVWANSVVTHMPRDDIETMMAAMRSLLAPGGQFFFTFAQAASARRKNIKDFWYPAGDIVAWGAAAGLQVGIMDDWPDRGDVMARAVVAAERSR